MKKTMISIRLDTDLVQWFRKNFPQGYQSQMNQILQNYCTESILTEQRMLGRAQEIFRQYYAQCFWHLEKDLEITAKYLPLVREGLRKYGGREGYQLAATLSNVKE